ncbi:VWA domain-containing protein [Candidatus Sumerlaeota bacterium]|nr:VWA domain-containing protein [Candidatus Sumerlaeota bacterium]
MWRNPNPNRLIRCAAAIAFLFFGAAAAPAAKVNLEVATANSVLLADKKQTTYLKVGLRALAEDIGKSRPLINAAIVLDKSGSMNGEKIERAKEAAQTYINGLHSNDIVSVITYDTNVCVLVPATKVSDKDQIFAAINRIRADGGTALFAGVSKGAAEVRKFLGKERVNRVVPSAPSGTSISSTT